MNKLSIVFIGIVFFVLIDLYAYQAVQVVVEDWAAGTRRAIAIAYWGLTVFSIFGLILYNFTDPALLGRVWRNFILVGLFVNYFSKIFALFVLVIDDIWRGLKWVIDHFKSSTSQIENKPNGITRSEFLAKTAIVAAAVPAISMGYGILSGAHDYRVRKSIIKLPHLPAAFDGIRIGQISDIHSGSFFNKKAVKGGVEMFLNEKPDLVFFTGDLVNNMAEEVKDYIAVFEKIKAPLGVFSTLGNHDYGDYMSWPSSKAKAQNLEDVKAAHKLMGYKLMMNENHHIQLNGENIAILGIENWGTGGFAKYGNLAKAHRGTEEAAVKLLLSHDPSHWDAQVRPEYADIDVMFAGHTHGFQLGIEWGDFKWSPAQCMYKQWAGLYQTAHQYLYVNRGFGFLGFPGRIGILPELTIVELQRG